MQSNATPADNSSVSTESTTSPAPETPAPQEPAAPVVDDWRHNPEVQNTIAAVKKETRQKALEEARREFQNQSQVPNQQHQYAAPTYQAPTPQIPDDLQDVGRKAVETRFRGASKFQDWDSKVGALQSVASHNPQVFQIVATALDLPAGVSENVVYELSKNPEKIEELKRVHPDYLAGELVKLMQPSSQTQTVVKKVAPEPLADIKAPPASGGSELTYDQMKAQHRASRNKYRK